MTLGAGSVHIVILVAIGLAVPLQPVCARGEPEQFQRLVPAVPPRFAPGTTGTEAGIWMVVDKAEQEIIASPHRLKDPELEGYLREVMCRLAPDYCDDIRLYVLRVPMFNASMMPNGVMQVWTGLLLRARSEAQAASVLGHELGHYLQRHMLNGFNRVKNTANAMAFLTLGLSGAVALGGISPTWGQASSSVGQLALVAGFFAFSRSQESEADRFGIQLLSDAGYDPVQAGAIWKNLIEEEDAATAVKEEPSIFFATHPKSEDRMEKLAQYAGQLERRSPDAGLVNASEYQQRLKPHMATLLEDELNLHQPGRTEYLYKGLLADGQSPELLKFYLGELYRIRAGEGDRDRAIQYYREALAEPGCPPEAHRWLGILYLKSRQFDLANESFSNYLAAKPEAGDREMIEYYMSMKE